MSYVSYIKNDNDKNPQIIFLTLIFYIKIFSCIKMLKIHQLNIMKKNFQDLSDE